MSDNSRFFLWMTTITGTVLVALVISSQAYSVAVNYQLLEAIKSGANAFDVACALDHGATRAAECAIRAAK